MKITNLGDATDFNVQGNPQTGKIVLHVRNASEAAGLAMTPTMTAQLIRELVLCLQASPDPEARAQTQIVGIRNLSAQTPHPNLVTLKYELELGVQLETTIEPDAARILRDQLTDSLDRLDAVPRKH